MKKDGSWKDFFEDPARFADAINGFGCNGEQVVKEEDIHEVDTQIRRLKIPKFVNSMAGRGVIKSGKSRDMLRKVALGVNYLIIGMEPQEEIDYSLPLRNMLYDVAEYEKQAANLRNLIPNYKINIISIRDIQDTSIFKTDLRYVLEFLRNAKDKEKLKELVENEPYYQSMDEDAYDVVVNYANVKKLVEVKDEYKDVEGRMNMCTAIREMMEDSKSEGRMEVIKRQVKVKLERGDSVEKIADDLVEELTVVQQIVKGLQQVEKGR